MEKTKSSYKAKEYYKKITEVEFTSVKKRDDIFLAHPKGSVKEYKLFGMCIRKKTYEEDIYKHKHRSGKFTESEVISEFYATFVKNNIVYRKGKVVVWFGNNSETYLFEDDDEAKDFLEDLLAECRMCGNELV